jgi:GAF domain-containing protein
MSIDPDALATSLRRLAGEQNPSGSVLSALNRVTEACVELFNVTGSGIMLADEQNIIRYVASSNGPGRILETVEADTGQGPCTEAFVTNRLVASDDLADEASRWPDLTRAVAPYHVHAVLGIPVRLGGIPVGTLDVYLDRRHHWDESELAAVGRYGDVVETTLTAALQAHTAGELANQLQYALDYRILIERAVGYLMARESVDAVTAFNRLRRAARNNRTKIGGVAEQVLDTGRLAQ